MIPYTAASTKASCRAPFPYWTASLRFPSPYAWADFTWPPILARVATPEDSQVYMAAAPTAATASLPTIPIQAISVRLYAVWTRDVAIIGRASSVRDVSIFPFSKSIFFFTNVTYCHRICIKLLLLYYFSALYAICITVRRTVRIRVYVFCFQRKGITYRTTAPVQSDIGLCHSRWKAL